MSLPELGLVLVLGLIVFGPKRIPQVAYTLGKVIREMRKAAAEVRRTIDVEDLRNDLRLRNMDKPPAGARNTVASASPLPKSNTGAVAPPRVGAKASSHLETSTTRGDSRLQAAAPAPSSAESESSLEHRLKAYLAQTDDTLDPARTFAVPVPARRAPRADVLTSEALLAATATGESVRTVPLPQRV